MCSSRSGDAVNIVKVLIFDSAPVECGPNMFSALIKFCLFFFVLIMYVKLRHVLLA